MANDKIDISAMSYTNKDFRSIYPEMLDLAKQLTTKWDPSKSNESDPGVVLLKEAAFVADHNNYNIDKNILENFLPSATQDISVRNITEMNGYIPRYYVSANGEVTIQWNRQENDNVSIFTIPAFTLVLSDPENSVTYTQTSDILISEASRATGWFIEGTLQELAINDSSTIHLDNLDDNNRIYFPETMVAQNGIYVRNVNQNDYNDLWERDNYLLTRPMGSRIYKVDYDSTKDLPYIEFPSDISSLIGDGLNIQYISTSGEAGNVSANTLTTIVSPSEFVINSFEQEIKYSENFSVWNAGAITNGKNPETIDEMYQSFRKVVGTFDTLVTCRDYANKIYTLTDFYDNPYVSNAYVTDRRTDYNNSTNVITYNVDSGNSYFKNISIKPSSLKFIGVYDSRPSSGSIGDMCVAYDESSSKYELYVYMNNGWVKNDVINLNDFSILTNAMTPYDLTIYALKVFSIADYLDNNPAYSYDKSFEPIDTNTLEIIKSELDEVKCICHNYKDANISSGDNDDVFCFKNFAPLKVMIWTYNKIYESQKDEILKNVYKALQLNFNPRNLEFGEELNNDNIKKVIIESDPRIKDIDIEYSYNLKAMMGNKEHIDVINDSTLLIDMISKNVLAGRVCLFEFYEDFNFIYGQTNEKPKDAIITVDGDDGFKTRLSINILQKGDQKYDTSKISRTSSTFISEGDNYQYTFNVKDINKFTLSSGQSYVLLKEDSFVLYPIIDGKVKKDEKVEYAPKDNVQYTLTNLTGDDISKTSTLTFLPVGEFRIVEDTIEESSNEGILNLDYTLNENEAIQIINPNYYSEYTYTTYVNYRYIAPNGYKIVANTEHTLKAGEKIILIYSKDGETTQDVLSEGNVVRTSFNLVPTDELSASGTKKDWTDPNTGILYVNSNFRQLSSNQTISLRKAMNTVLNSSGIWCYWITDNVDDVSGNVLFTKNEDTRILRNGEFFIYTNSNLDEMMILGSGTMLKRTDKNDSQWIIDSSPKDITSITRDGTSANIPWKKNIDFVNNNLTITEMNVTTLGEGDRIIIFDWKNPPKVLENDFIYCNGSIHYMIDGSELTLHAIDNYYQIRSRLDINCSKDHPQKLYKTNTSTQEIILNKDKVISSKISSEGEEVYYIQTSKPLAALGDTILFDGNKVFNYKRMVDKVYNTIIDYPRTIIIDTDGKGGSQEYPFFYESSKEYIIPIFVKGDAADNTKWDEDNKGIRISIWSNYSFGSHGQIQGEQLPICDFNSDDSSEDYMYLKGNSAYYITLKDDLSKNDNLCLFVEWPSTEEGEKYSGDQYITIGNINVIDGLNTDVKLPTFGKNDPYKMILERINEIISESDSPSTKPYYIYKPDNSIAIDNTDFTDPNFVWDINNIINQFTIPQIDFNNSEFNFRKSMILKDLSQDME